MARPHSDRSHHIRTEKPGPPAKAAENLTPAPADDETEALGGQSGLYVALVVWGIGFFALMVWVLFDLIIGLLQ